MNQQPFDWAIVQSEALAQIRSLGLPVPSKSSPLAQIIVGPISTWTAAC